MFSNESSIINFQGAILTAEFYSGKWGGGSIFTLIGGKARPVKVNAVITLNKLNVLLYSDTIFPMFS